MKTVAKLLISIAMLALLIWWAGIDDLVTSLRQANLWFVLPGIGLYLFGQWVSALRWQYLAHAIGFSAPRATYVDGYLLGMVASLFLPSAIGGDAIRGLLLARQCGKRKRDAVLTLLAERGVGLVIMLWLVAIALVTPNVREVVPPPICQGVWLASIGLLTGWGMMYVLPIHRWATPEDPPTSTLHALIYNIAQLIHQAQPYWRHPNVLATSLGLSLVVQGIMVITHIGIAFALGIFPAPADIGMVTTTYGLAQLAGVLPVAFAGFGLREGAYQWLLGLVGVSPTTGLAFGLYWALIMLLTTALAGGWLLWRRPDLWQWLKTATPKPQPNNEPLKPNNASPA